MRHTFFFAGHETELRALIRDPNTTALHRQLDDAPCRGMDVDAFHPDEGRPDHHVLARCDGCPAHLACLAFALRSEDPGARQGWYGGLGPEDRDGVAAILGLETPEPPPDRAIQATRLRDAGWPVRDIAAELGCSRRTVQRYLRVAA